MRIHFFKLLLLITMLAMSSGDILAQYNWMRYPGNPVLSSGPSGSWYRHLKGPTVLYNADSSRYEMWFTAAVNFVSFNNTIGFAVSDDGISWSMHTSSVLSPSVGKWDSYTAEFPCVIRENGLYKMYYAGNSADNFYYKIGLATSLDGINWTKDTLHNPVFGPGTQLWELAGPGYCCVMSVSGGYKMWYTSAQANGLKEYTGYATSFDGISWERDTLNNPVLGPGAAGQWDEFLTVLPRVLFIDNYYYMWYLGGRFQYSQLRGGLALSSDGITNWYKVPENPVLQTTPGQWDGTDVEIGSVIMIADSLYLYYDGRGTRWQIGLAKCSFEPVSVEIEETLPIEFVLEQNYPNPFNPSTTISWQSPAGSHQTVKVFDVLGNEIATLVDEYKPAGSYNLEFRIENSELSSGVYFYQLKAVDPSTGSGQGFIETKKMLLLK